VDDLVRALSDDRPSLHVPWGDLGRLIRPVPGTLMILLGAPGAMKSMLSLVWCLELGAPSRIISLDTDPLTQAARVVARLAGTTTKAVLDDPGKWAPWLLEQKSQMRLLHEPVQAEEIGQIMEADAEFWGQVPALVVVDDVSKLKMKDRSYQDFDGAMLELHRAAKKHQTVVLALHHLHRGDSSNRTKPIRLSDGKYTGEYEAEIVLGAWRPSEKEMRVAVLKNRFGVDNPNGGLSVQLHADPATVDIRDHEYGVFGMES
jgi:hypothetical protein